MDNRYREKLKELTENNLKDRGIGIEHAENPDDENDNLDKLKEENLTVQSEKIFNTLLFCGFKKSTKKQSIQGLKGE